MFKLPNEQSYHQNTNYTQVFALTFLFNLSLIVAAFLLLFLVFLVAKICLARRRSNQLLKESILTSEQQSQSRAVAASESSQAGNQSSNSRPKTKAFKVVSFFASFFFYCFWISASLIYVNFYMFGDFGRASSLDVLSVFAVTLIVLVPTLIWKHLTKTTPWSEQRREIVALVVLLVLWLAVSVFLVVATKGVCVCFYNNKYGFKIDDDVEISSEFTRLNSISTICPDSTICHLYATVPEDASTAVFFNAHAGTNLDQLTFTLKLNGAAVGRKNSSSPFKMDNVESIGQRTVHSVLFSGLTANTTYSLQVSDRTGSILKQTNYKTVPGADAGELRMAVGGDLGVSTNGDTMTSYLFNYNPDIIIIGGDIAYDDAMRSCYYSWDTVYAMFEPAYQKLNRLIPIVFNVGNHDVGFDALTDNKITATNEEIPLFFVYNPQHLAHNQQEVPELFDRDTLHYHKIGPTIHFLLDSGYLKTYQEQLSFIKLHSLNNTGLYRFANYHNPIYPACTNSNPGSNDRLVIENGTKYWTPVFDDLSFVAAMEHHTHFRKITYKMKGDLPNNQTGTRYIGDGSWGVTEIYCSESRLTPRPEIMQDFARENPNHMWQITLTRANTANKKYSIVYKAINLQEKVVFEVKEELPELV